MKFKTLIGGSIVVGSIAISSFAGATAPTVTITAPTDDAIVQTTTFPKTVTISGTVSHSGGTGNNVNLCLVKDFVVSVDDGNLTTDPVVIGSKSWSSGGDAANCPVDDTFSFPFPANEPGVYTVTATGHHTNDTGSDSAAFTIERQLVVTYPAAPSVAAEILQEHTISARYGSGKTGGNHIADVAAEMSKSTGTDFMGIAKKDVEAYREAVLNFLRTKSIPASV